MLILPAIDIRNGVCVRLRQGRFDLETAYDTDPAAVAASFVAEGFTHVHVVDLDGARTGVLQNIEMLTRILEVRGIVVEAGGGIRDRSSIDRLLGLGVWRVMLGSVAVRNPALVYSAIRDLGDTRIALAVDMQDERLMAQGWTEGADATPAAFIRSYLDKGARTFHCTDVSRDGMLQGPNVDWYAELSAQFPEADVVAAGGVRSVDDLGALHASGVGGAVVGRALYDGNVSLTDIRGWISSIR